MGQTQTEVIPQTATVDSPFFEGQIARTRHCEVSDFTETEERTEHEGELRQGVGAYLGSVGTTGAGIGMLAASQKASDEPEAGESTSPKTQLQVMGTTATVVGGIWLAHTLYQTARSIDRTERHKNQIDKKVSDQICQSSPIPGASIALSSPDLGIEHPVPLEPTDGTGNFRVDLTKIRGFQWPAVINERLMVVMHLDGQPLNKQPLGDWTLEWAKKLDECSSEATCLAVGETAQRQGDGFERVAERAQKVADFYKYGSAIDVVSQSYRKVGHSDVWHEGDPYIEFEGRRAYIREGTKLGRQNAVGVHYKVDIANKTGAWVMGELQIYAALEDCKHLGERGSIVSAFTKACSIDDERTLHIPVFLSPRERETFEYIMPLKGASIDLAKYVKGNIKAQGSSGVEDISLMPMEMRSILIEMHEDLSMESLATAIARVSALEIPEKKLLLKRLNQLAEYYTLLGVL